MHELAKGVRTTGRHRCEQFGIVCDQRVFEQVVIPSSE
jgi:hypothetical protein